LSSVLSLHRYPFPFILHTHSSLEKSSLWGLPSLIFVALLLLPRCL
jgi:hypothetical protein